MCNVVTGHQAVAILSLSSIMLLGAQIGAMIDNALVEAGHADLVVQEVAVMAQAGFATEAAKLARQNMLVGNQVPWLSASTCPMYVFGDFHQWSPGGGPVQLHR